MELTTSHGSLREIGVSLGGSLHLMTAAQSPQTRAAGQAQCSVPGSWGPPGYRRFGASDGTTPLGCETCANSCKSPAPGWLANGHDVTGRPQCRRCKCNSSDGALSRLDAIAFEQRNHQMTRMSPPIQRPAEQTRHWLYRSEGPGGLALQYPCLVANAETSLDDRHVQGSQLNQRLQRHCPDGRLSRAASISNRRRTAVQSI